jgi:hypothetical protein
MRQLISGFFAWLARVDPGAHRRVKGLRLVTTYGLALALGGPRDVTAVVPGHASLATVAAAIALWACVSEARGVVRSRVAISPSFALPQLPERGVLRSAHPVRIAGTSRLSP